MNVSSKSIKDLSDESGVSATTIRRWAKGKTKPQTEKLAQLAKGLGFSTIEELLADLKRKLEIAGYEQSSEVAERNWRSLEGVQRDVFLIRFLNEPASQRSRVWERARVLEKTRQSLRRSHSDLMDAAEELFEDVVQLEANLI